MMYKLFRIILCILFSSVSLVVFGQDKEADKPRLDIVFCLDLSGSTNGLIDNVRENIWSMANLAERFEPGQEFRIGVVGMSRPSFGKSNFYIKVLSELTGDLDRLQADLYKLKSQIEKGDQFISNALETVLFQMNWSKSDNAVKIIFLIGNGNVNTGSSDYRTVVDDIRASGIHLVPVYCLRSRTTPDREGWDHIGRISGFDSESIMILKRDPFVKAINARDKLIYLNQQLNRLMIPYTKNGVKSASNIKLCDNKAILCLPDVYENRLFYRVSRIELDRMKEWDLVSAELASPASLKDFDLSLLHDSLQIMSPEALFELVEKMKTESAAITQEIKKLLPDERQKLINVLLEGTFEKDYVLERVLLQNIIRINGLHAFRLN
jgi:D-ribose pyranose/furanose isomerase RbsD